MILLIKCELEQLEISETAKTLSHPQSIRRQPKANDGMEVI